jgi:biopolymer transport protein ExbD
MRIEVHENRRREPDLTSLVNIVFLILIFFIVAGSLRPFGDRELELTKLADGAINAHVDGRLLVHADGRIAYKGQPTTLPDLAATLRGEKAAGGRQRFDIVADHRAPAAQVLAIATALKAAGYADIAIVTQRSTK